jgi:hypothetical protein
MVVVVLLISEERNTSLKVARMAAMEVVEDILY